MTVMVTRYPVISDDPERQAFYVARRLEGQSHNMAEMLALQQFPASKTDREFLRGLGTLHDQFEGDEWGLNYTVQQARCHGYNPNASDFYMGGLARFTGDPEAFVPAHDARGYVKRTCEKRGVACHGMVDVKAPERQPPPPVPLAESTVREKVRELHRKDPRNRTRPYAELREQVIAKHGPQSVKFK